MAINIWSDSAAPAPVLAVRGGKAAPRSFQTMLAMVESRTSACAAPIGA